MEANNSIKKIMMMIKKNPPLKINSMAEPNSLKAKNKINKRNMVLI